MRWSFSKFSKVEQCGLGYYRHYELGERGPSSDPLRKGSLVHEVLETVARVAVAKRYSGPLDLEKTLALYSKLWGGHYPDGGTAGHYQDGEEIVAAWVERTQTIDYRRIVAIEKRFSLPLGDDGDTLIGFIDIVERDADGRLVIKDYKTNRAMYTRDEVDESMQLGIYALAAEWLYPGEPAPRLCYDMLRHGYEQYTERTPEALATLGRYLGTLAARVVRWSESSTYPPTLNKLCGWCSHRTLCPEYQGALEVGELEGIDPQDWDALGLERERMAAVEKAARGRRGEIDGLLRVRCKQNGAVEAGGRVYRLSKTTKRTHRPEKVAEVLAEALGVLGEDSSYPGYWLPQVATVSTDKLKRIIKGSDLDRSGQLLLEARLDGVATARASAMLRSSKAKG